jgi:hypothetical protein
MLNNFKKRAFRGTFSIWKIIGHGNPDNNLDSHCMWQLRYGFTILDVGTRWRLSASSLGRFTPIERTFYTRKIGDWVGSIVILETVGSIVILDILE